MINKQHSKAITNLQKEFTLFFQRIDRCKSPASFKDERDQVEQLKVVLEHLESLLKAASDYPADIDAYRAAMDELCQNELQDITVTLSSVFTFIPLVGNFNGQVAHGKYDEAFNTLQSSNSEVPSAFKVLKFRCDRSSAKQSLNSEVPNDSNRQIWPRVQ